MKAFHILCTCLLSPILISHAPALEIKAGIPLEEAKQAMEEAGYPYGLNLAMASSDPEKRELGGWSVDQGVLIVVYAVEKNRILGLTFYLSDERPKAERATFEFDVISFNTETGQLLLQLNPPEETQEAE